MKKIVNIIVCVVMTMIFITATQINATYAAEGLKIHYIDVGSADSIYIECGGQNMLIDGGYLSQYDRSGETNNDVKTPLDKHMHDGDDTVLDPSTGKYIEKYKKLLTDNDNSDVTKYLDSLGVKNIDYVVSTHPHYDHIGGLLQVINKYSYQHLLFNGRDYKAYLPLFKQLADYNESKTGVALTTAKNNQVIELGTGNQKAKITVLTDQNIDYSTISGRNELNTISNNGSLVLKLEYGKRSFLFTADAQVAAQRELMKNKPTDITNIDILKVPHHGYNNNDFNSPDKSGNYEFFKLANPVVSIVSCGIENNNSTLPTNRVIKDLSMSDIYTTKELGNIVLSCDGERVLINYKNKTIYAFSKGDVNMDGAITPADYVMLRKHVNGTSPLVGGRYRAANVNEEIEVTPSDYVKLRKVINGTASL